MPNNKDELDEFSRMDSYRNKLEDDIIESEKDFNTFVTWLAGGALGLFLTINEKVFHLFESHYLWVFVVSLSALFLTLILSLYSKHYDTQFQKNLRDRAYKQIEKKDYDASKLDKYWVGRDHFMRILMTTRMILVIAGIAAEIIFIVINMQYSH